jgi:hypothetical protein
MLLFVKIHENNALGELGNTIGKGLFAGLAATAAITISQMIEMKITKREPGDAPVKVVFEPLALNPRQKMIRKNYRSKFTGLMAQAGHSP